MNAKDGNNKVKLWTRQDIRSLKQLEATGRIKITEEHLREKFGDMSNYILELYRWFNMEAGKIVNKPDDVEYPVWCSISKENMLRPTENTVVYVLEVDRSKIIYFDGSKWDYVLNHLYIPKDKDDEERYNKELEDAGFKHGFSFINKEISHFYPERKKQVIDSWNRVFEIDEWNIFKVQANIWEIKKDMIKDIIYYNGE